MTDQRIAFICDRKKCKNCYSECLHTTDINHAANFEKTLAPDTWFESKQTGEKKMENKALEIVRAYIKEHLDRSDATPEFDVYTVWKCKALQNWKFLISSSLYDGMYYELTYNGDKHEWYLDAYKKFENRCIPSVERK